MNVYIESLYKELSGSNCSIDIFTKCHKSHFEKVTQISPSLRVIHVDGIPENIEKNAVHGSDSVASAEREIAYFFETGEIHSHN